MPEATADYLLKEGITYSLQRFADMLIKTAEYGEKIAKDTKNPGKEMYWGGYIDGLRDAATMALTAAKHIE